MIDTYFWKIKYYNDFVERNLTSCGTIGAKSYNDAVQKIETRFGGIYSIDKITIYRGDFCDGFTFFEDDEELWNQIMKNHMEF